MSPKTNIFAFLRFSAAILNKLTFAFAKYKIQIMFAFASLNRNQHKKVWLVPPYYTVMATLEEIAADKERELQQLRERAALKSKENIKSK